jgi:hypothetical protein
MDSQGPAMKGNMMSLFNNQYFGGSFTQNTQQSWDFTQENYIDTNLRIDNDIIRQLRPKIPIFLKDDPVWNLERKKEMIKINDHSDMDSEDSIDSETARTFTAMTEF